MFNKLIQIMHKIKDRIFYPFNYVKFILNHRKLRKKKKIVLLLTPEFGNLGDHALNYAQRTFFEDNYPDYPIIEITYNESKAFFYYIKKIINDNDILVLMGGGNIGDIYHNVEYERRKIISEFSNNIKISMPQSINFTNTKSGNLELEKAKKIYSDEKLIILCRDERSYQFAISNFQNENIYLLPDIVLYWSYEYEKKIEERNDGALLLLRNDKEKNMNDNVKENIFFTLQRMKIKYSVSDTHVNKNLLKDNRLKAIKNKLEEIRSSRFVITDRYHGVIFSVITKTPCIAFKSKDHKIEEGIKWLKHHNYIFYLGEKDSNLEETIKLLYKIADENIVAPKQKDIFINFFKENNLIR